MLWVGETVTVSRINWEDEQPGCVVTHTNCYRLPLKVRENRALREAERQRQQGEREARRGTREEAKRREREEETRKKQQARRQEEMMQQEMVRLRRQMEERRGLEQLVRQRYGIHSNQIASHIVILPVSPSYGGLNGLMVTY